MSAIKVTIVLSVLLAAAAAAQERGDVPPFRVFDEQSERAPGVPELVERFRKAWGGQDVETLRALHADDVEWINAYGRMFRGAAPLAEFLETRLFPAFDPAVSLEEAERMSTVSIRYIGSIAAVVHLYTEGRRGTARDDGDERRTHVHLVLELRADQWKIVHAAIMDAR